MKSRSQKKERRGRSYRSIDSDNEEYEEEEDDREEEGEEEEEEYEIDQSAEIELRDATIKLIRLLANLSIDATIGMEIGQTYDNLQVKQSLFIFRAIE